ncbi:hypothetical protein GCK32_019782, partial [Trichostrongylus colubriformis]
GEKLGTIEEELTHWSGHSKKLSTTRSTNGDSLPKKSATFHNIVDLQRTRAPHPPHQSNSDQQAPKDYGGPQPCCYIYDFLKNVLLFLSYRICVECTDYIP